MEVVRKGESEMKSFIDRIKRWFKPAKTSAVIIPDYINFKPYVEIVLDSKLKVKMRRILDMVRGCSKVSWDLWEIGDKFPPQMAIWDFNQNCTNWTTANKRIEYCATKDEFISRMMVLSLAHEIVEMKLVKSMDGSHGIIMILFCGDGDGKTNIDADLIDYLASAQR